MDADPKVENFELTPKASTPDGGLEVHVQVFGATTHLELGGCPVKFMRYADATSATVLDSTTLFTDGNGYVLFQGLPVGFYEFHVNDTLPGRPGWHSVGAAATMTSVKALRYEITATSALNVMLKPKEYSMTFHVTGYDFVKNTFGPHDLGDILVEIVAVDPNDPARELMSPISDLTDNDEPPDPTGDLVEFGAGKVIFNHLPPVAHRVTVKEIGYFEYSDVIFPLPDGSLDPTPPLIVLAPEENLLMVSPVFPGFKSNNELPMPDPDGISGLGLEVNLIGLDGTKTEGIRRRNFVKETPPFDKGIANFSEPYFDFAADPPMHVPPSPAFLKPGRYKLIVSGYIEERVDWSHPAGSSFDNRVSFAVQHEEIVEVPATGPEFFGIPGFVIDYPVPIMLQPLTLTGRLFKADAIDAVRGDPVYEPMGGETIEFAQPHGLGVLMGSPTFTTTTAADGSYSVDLPPGIFALNIPTAVGYTGGRVEKTIIHSADPFRIGETTSESALHTDRWPFSGPWPDALGDSAKVRHYFNGRGLEINGHDVSTLDLFLHKNAIGVEANITEFPGPTSDRLVALDDSVALYNYITYPNSRIQNTGGTIDLMEMGGATLPTPLIVKRPTEGGTSPMIQRICARWECVPPGTYDPSFSNPGYSVTGAPSTSLWYPDFPTPGGVPDPVTAGLLGTLPTGSRPPRPLERFDSWILAIEETDVPNSISFLQYNAGTMMYEPATTPPTITFIELTGGGASAQDGFFKGSEFPAAEGFAWIQVSGVDFWKVAHDGTLKINGPDQAPFTALPGLNFELRMRAFAIEDDNKELAGVMLTSRGQTITTVTGATPVAFTGLTGFGSVTLAGGQNWIPQPQNDDIIPTFVSASGAKTTLEQKFFVERGVEIRVEVAHDTTADPIVSCPVRVYNRYGAFQKAATTGTDGKVSVMALPGHQDYFVEVSYPGFAPQRRALRTATLLDDMGQMYWNAVFELVPTAQPTITTTGVPLSRKGAFLPGVTRSGDASVSDLFSAIPALTADWSITIEPATVIYSLPGFDDAAGMAGAAVPTSFVDQPRAVYLIDRRKFEESGSQGDEDTSETFPLPEDSYPQLMRVFLRDLVSQKFGASLPKIYGRVTREVTKSMPAMGGMPAVDAGATGKVKLWELPHGKFKPAFIVETVGGAFKTFSVDPAHPDNLTGIPIPEWLGFAFDLLGISAGIAATQEQMAKYVPESDLIPFPDFTATIGLTPAGAGKSTIDYTYALSVGAEVGQDSPKAGIAKLLPALIGAEAKGTATITSIGADNELTLDLTGTVQACFDGDKWIPDLVRSLDPSFTVCGKTSLSSSASVNVDEMVPYDLRLRSRRSAQLDLDASVDITEPVTSKIPYAGPVLLALSKAGVLTNRATFDASINVTTSNCFETLKPDPPTKIGSVDPLANLVDPNPRNRRRNFMGGQWCKESGKTTYTMSFGVGMILGLDGPLGFGLEGKGRAGLDNLTIEANKFGDFMPVSRISGEFTLSAEGTVKTPIKNFSRSYKWTALKFDAQYGTETVVQFTPMEVLIFTESLATTGASVLSGMAPQLVKNASPLSWFDISSSEPDVLLSPSYNPATGMVDLVLAARGVDLAWTAGATVASVAEMGPNAIMRLPDGRLLIAWIQPPGASTLDPFAAMDVNYVLGDAGDTTFTAPATLVSAPAGLATLELHNSGGTLALFTVMQSGGYSTPKHDLFGFTFDATTDTWSAPIPLDSAPSGYKELAVLSGGASGPAEFGIASLDSGHTLSFALWDGVAASPPPSVLASDIEGGLAGNLSAGGHTLVVAETDGDLLRYDRPTGAGMSFGAPVTLTTDLVPLEATLLPRPSGGYLYSYTSPTSEGSEIVVIGIDAANALIGSSPVAITENTFGAYHDLHAVSPLGGIVHLYARYSGSANNEIRIFEVTEDLLLSSNDSDADGLRDMFELRIIDADETDGLAMIGDVLGTDDFDGDGFPNAKEELHGSDPADATSHPAYPAALAAWLTARGYSSTAFLFLDDDANGWDLGQEYAFGIEPGSVAGVRHPVLEASGANLRYLFTRRPGLTYTVQRGDSSLSGIWTDITPLSTTLLSTNPDGTENVAIEFTTFGAPEFIRALANICP